MFFDCLSSPSDLDDITNSVLEHICSVTKRVLERQLSDQTMGGRLYIQIEDIDQNLVMQKTNRISEVLDRNDKQIPQKSRSGRSGVIYTGPKQNFLIKLKKSTLILLEKICL